MNTITNQAVPNDLGDKPWLLWAPVAVGLAAMYIPTYIRLAEGIWKSEEQGHGPLILAVVVWLVWQSRSVLVDAEGRPSRTVGFGILVFGLLCYILGRSQDILMLEVGSHIPVLAGLVVALKGWGAIRKLWFPLMFFVFMVPLPGPFIDALTGPLKHLVSLIAEHLLYGIGYPIARSGVTLSIGPYQLLVADACSGLHSMFSLSALGLLYLYLMKHPSITRNVIIVASILPIAFVANIIRVMILVLVTYHLGDEAGQGFLHGFAGMMLFVIALLLLFALDAICGLIFRDKASRG